LECGGLTPPWDFGAATAHFRIAVPCGVCEGGVKPPPWDFGAATARFRIAVPRGVCEGGVKPPPWDFGAATARFRIASPCGVCEGGVKPPHSKALRAFSRLEADGHKRMPSKFPPAAGWELIADS